MPLARSPLTSHEEHFLDQVSVRRRITDQGNDAVEVEEVSMRALTGGGMAGLTVGAKPIHGPRAKTKNLKPPSWPNAAKA